MNTNIQWFFASGKTPIGPLSFIELKTKAYDGFLTLKTKVWHKDLGNWTYANDVAEVSAMIVEITNERMSKPRWMVVIDKKAKREAEGPFSDIEVEKNLLNGVFLKETIYWRTGQEGWHKLEMIPELVEAKVRVDLARALRPPEIDETPEPEKIPDIPDEEDHPFSDNENHSSQKNIDARSKPDSEIGTSGPSIKSRSTSPEEVFVDALFAVFAGSRWLSTVQVFADQLSKGIHSGDAIKINGAVEKIRLFLLREVQPDRSARHPAMTHANLKFVSEELLALLLKPEVIGKVEKFDPFYNLDRDAVPSITATRMRALLGTVKQESFYSESN